MVSSSNLVVHSAPLGKLNGSQYLLALITKASLVAILIGGNMAMYLMGEAQHFRRHPAGNSMRVVELYANAGGMSLGLQRAGFQVV